MLLTQKPSQQLGYADPYACSPVQRSPSSYYATPPKSASSLPPLPDSRPREMTTPHRGLPPPSAMERSLPLPERAPPTNAHSLGALPNAPTQWHGQDESMRSWLQAKSEEDRRKQEEEKSRQEGLKLEQRKIEQNMLQESLRGGIPPPMVPMIFASMGGANVANLSVEWAQHYMAQISLQQQQQQQQAQIQQQQVQQQQVQQVQQIQQPPPQIQASPEQRRDNRLLTGPNPNPYGAQQMQPQMQPPTQNIPPQAIQPTQPTTSFAPAYQTSTLPADRVRPQQQLQAAPPTSNPRPPTSSSLTRLNTGDLHAPPPGTSALQLGGQHPLQQTQTTQQQEQPSSPLYFHHWQPPDAQGKSKDKEHGTPSGKSQHTSPNQQPAGSHLRSEYTTSPKKRKATGGHQPAPTPSSHTSPSFSHQGSSGSNSGRRRRANSRVSDTSSHSQPRTARESGRQSFSEAENGRNSAHPETRHPHHQHPAGSDGREMGEIRHVSRELSERNSPKREA